MNVWFSKRVRLRWPRCLVIVVTICIVALPLGGGSKPTKVKYGGAWRLGWRMVKVESNCYSMNIAVVSPFLEQLEKKIERNGTAEFQQASQPVTSFPDDLNLQARVRQVSCPTRAAGVIAVGLLPGPLQPDHLVFQVHWLAGVKALPAELKLKKVFKKLWPELSGTEWEYSFALSSKGMSLNNELQVVVLKQDKTEVSRFSGRL